MTLRNARAAATVYPGWQARAAEPGSAGEGPRERPDKRLDRTQHAVAVAGAVLGHRLRRLPSPGAAGVGRGGMVVCTDV